jgi:hypothetical protein
MESAIGQACADGRIPFTFRIGVTGHRKLDNPAYLGPAVHEAVGRLMRLLPVTSGTELVPVVVSALAEGADRVVAREILAVAGSRLEAALPLPLDDYLDDFMSEDSKTEIRDLLGRASEIWTAPPSASRDEAYEQAGRYVVDRSDAVVAIWDGEPAGGRGGTGAIVAYARGQGIPLAWVRTKGDPPVSYELNTVRAEVIRDAARKLDEYNTSVIKAADLRLQARAQRERLMPEAPMDSDTARLCVSCEKVADWLIPYFLRADALALRLQRRFWALSSAIFTIAAAAVTVVAIQVTFFPHMNWLVALEVLLLLCLLSIPLVNHRWRLHDRWISCRFLAERLRSCYFLALAGTGDRRQQPARLAYLSDSSEAWIERALTEVMSHRPGLGPPGVESLRDYLNHYWIGSQISYHEKSALLQRRNDRRLIGATGLLFAITLIAAVAHMLGIGDHGSHMSSWAKLLIVISVSVPAIGAAVHGIGTQRQFRRHSQRYTRMAVLLTQLREEMGQAASFERVKEVAAETERILREENSDWFGVMRFHDMELIT